MAGDDDIDEAMTRLAQGDRDAFDRVFGYAWPRVMAYCFRALGEREAAQDAAQLAMEKVFFRACDFEAQRGSAMTWILTIATYEVRTVMTRRRRQAARAQGGWPVALAEPETPEEQVLWRELQGHLRALLETLDEGDRRLIEDLLQGRRSHLDDVSPAAVRKRRQRALERLRQAWRMLYGTS